MNITKQFETLKKIFYDPREGLTSTANLYRKAKIIDPSITQSIVKEFIKSQPIYQEFNRQLKTPYFPLISYRNFDRCQMDLMDMSSESGRNNMKWIFVLIDCFTKVAFCVPMKTKSINDVYYAFTTVLNEMKDKFNSQPSVIDCDNESSFNSLKFKSKCNELNIVLHFNLPGQKLGTAIVERFNRTLRNLIERYKVSHNTNIWVNALPDLVYNYNNSHHSSLNTTLFKSIENNDYYLYLQQQKINNASAVKYNISDIQIGSKVRLRIERNQFEKGTKPKFSKNIHTVTNITKGLGGVLYTVTDRERPYRKSDLQLVSDETPIIVDDSRQIEENKERQQRRIQRNINKEGLNPSYRYIGDPTQSLEYKYDQEVKKINTRLRPR